MKTITQTIYRFNELSNEAKQKVIDNHYENEEYDFLYYDLSESLREYLKEANCEFYDIKLYYSLTNCQGDGLCFEGDVYKDGKRMMLKHIGRYYHSKSVEMSFFNEEGEEIEIDEELKDIYFTICNKLEKEGYSVIEYRVDFDEFNDFAEANEYEYFENGTQYQ